MLTRGSSESGSAPPSLHVSVRTGLCFHICKMGAARAGPAEGLLPGLGDPHLVQPDMHHPGAPTQPSRGAGQELRGLCCCLKRGGAAPARVWGGGPGVGGGCRTIRGWGVAQGSPTRVPSPEEPPPGPWGSPCSSPSPGCKGLSRGEPTSREVEQRPRVTGEGGCARWPLQT